MNKQHTIHFMFAALLICGACSTVQRAPVVDRQETDTATEAAAEPDDSAPAGAQAEDDDSVTWSALPEPENAMPPAAVDMPAAPAPGRISANPAVIALLDDTDLRLSQGNTEGALSAVERALRLEPKNPWLWRRLALLRLRQGQWRQAIALAEKSNSLSTRHPEIRSANAELIKRAREQETGR